MGEAFLTGQVSRAPSLGVTDVLRRKEHAWYCCVDDSERCLVRWSPCFEEYMSGRLSSFNSIVLVDRWDVISISVHSVALHKFRICPQFTCRM